MRPDLSELADFYGSDEGEFAQRLVNSELRKLWPDLSGQRMLGIGFPEPFLEPFDEAERRIALMPATQGAHSWPRDGANRAVLGREDELPFADGDFDCVLMAHALECSPHANRLMREVWRVLADGGRLLLIVPNRRGLWCWSERTPFGYGQPYSLGQLERTLTNHLFEITGERVALVMPPLKRSIMRRMLLPAERVCKRWLPQLAGVLLLEAEKTIYVGTPALAAIRPSSRRYLPVLENATALTVRAEPPERSDNAAKQRAEANARSQPTAKRSGR